ncbi:MAG: tRNA (adenosine(37)-N6)-dimethylallyltransferase MiaA [Actinomyces sp.]|nr:MAG: tRNA (adenosine(37)-N6)-dimethylallyltransferase MiaA [Actinomyces sp.]
MTDRTPPVGLLAARPLVLVGTTASGKTALALAVAERIPGAEIVSVDSMAVYAGLRIGTAAPGEEDLARVPHHLVGHVDPAREHTVGEFAREARRAVADIRDRGGVPILVGGTGLYVRAVVDELDIPPRHPEVRRRLEGRSTAELAAELTRLDPVAASRIEAGNRRRLVRALEVTLGSGRPFSSYGPGLTAYPPTPYVQVGIRRTRADIDARIERRLDAQLAAGWLDECRALLGRPLSHTARQALGYAELFAHLAGEYDLAEARSRIARRSRRLARRQERWFRRDPRLVWLDAPVDPDTVVAVWENSVRGAGDADGFPDATMGTRQ